MPGLKTNLVMTQPINLTIANPKNAAINPNTPTLIYHTPTLILTGHSGNMTPARTRATIPPANTSCLNGLGSSNQT